MESATLSYPHDLSDIEIAHILKIGGPELLGLYSLVLMYLWQHKNKISDCDVAIIPHCLHLNYNEIEMRNVLESLVTAKVLTKSASTFMSVSIEEQYKKLEKKRESWRIQKGAPRILKDSVRNPSGIPQASGGIHNPNPNPNHNPNKNPKKKGNQKEIISNLDLTDLPEPFRSEDIHQAMMDWVVARSLTKAPVTSIALRNVWLEWKDSKPDHFLAAVRNSVANGYRGIFPAPDKTGFGKVGFKTQQERNEEFFKKLEAEHD